MTRRSFTLRKALSEIIRARMIDFIKSIATGIHIKVDRESLNNKRLNF